MIAYVSLTVNHPTQFFFTSGIIVTASKYNNTYISNK